MKTYFINVLTLGLIMLTVSCELLFDPEQPGNPGSNTTQINIEPSPSQLNFKTGQPLVITINANVSQNTAFDLDEYSVKIDQSGKAEQSFLAYYRTGNMVRVWPYAEGIGGITLTHPKAKNTAHVSVLVKLDQDQNFIITKTDTNSDGTIKQESSNITITTNREVLRFTSPTAQSITLSASANINATQYKINLDNSKNVAFYRQNNKIVFIPYKNENGTIRISHPRAENEIALPVIIKLPPGEEFDIDEDDANKNNNDGNDGELDPDSIDDPEKREDVKKAIDDSLTNPEEGPTTDGKALTLGMETTYKRIKIGERTTIKVNSNIQENVITWTIAPPDSGSIIEDGGKEAVFIPAQHGSVEITASIGERTSSMTLQVDQLTNSILTFKPEQEIYTFTNDQQIVTVAVVLTWKTAEVTPVPLKWEIHDENVVTQAANINPQLTSLNLTVKKTGNTKITVTEPLSGKTCEMSLVVNQPQNPTSQLRIIIPQKDIQAGETLIYRVHTGNKEEPFTWSTQPPEPSNKITITPRNDGKWVEVTPVDPLNEGSFTLHVLGTETGRTAETTPLEVTRKHFIDIKTESGGKEYLPNERTYYIDPYSPKKISISAYPKPKVLSVNNLESLSQEQRLYINQTNNHADEYTYAISSYGKSSFEIVMQAGDIKKSFYVVTHFSRSASLGALNGSTIHADPKITDKPIEPITVTVDDATEDGLVAARVNFKLTTYPEGETPLINIQLEKGADVITFKRTKDDLRITPRKAGRAVMTLTDRRDPADVKIHYYTIDVKPSDKFWDNHKDGINVVRSLTHDDQSTKGQPIPKEWGKRPRESGKGTSPEKYRHNYDSHKDIRISHTFTLDPIITDFIGDIEFHPQIHISGDTATPSKTIKHHEVKGFEYYLFGELGEHVKNHVHTTREQDATWTVAEINGIYYETTYPVTKKPASNQHEETIIPVNENRWINGIIFSQITKNKDGGTLQTEIYLPDLLTRPSGAKRYTSLTITFQHYFTYGEDDHEIKIPMPETNISGSGPIKQYIHKGRDYHGPFLTEFDRLYTMLVVPATPVQITY